MKPLLSVVVPVCNEEASLFGLHERLVGATSPLSAQYNWEFLFIDDGSQDRSREKLDIMQRVDPRVAIIEFSRNFGKEAATSAGLHHAQGSAVIVMDADLQHPPELIPKMIAAWEHDTDVVVGVRSGPIEGSHARRWGARLYGFFMRRFADVPITPHETDFRLLDRRVVVEFNRLTERTRLTRGLINWLGFRRTAITFDAPARQNGKSSNNFPRLAHTAIAGFVSHSMLPLKAAGYLGVMITAIAAPLAGYVFLSRFILKQSVFSGIAIVAVSNVLLIGVVLMCLGLIALYIGSIHEQVSRRPLYVIRRKTMAQKSEDRISKLETSPNFQNAKPVSVS